MECETETVDSVRPTRVIRNQNAPDGSGHLDKNNDE
jgi:hypothetical protein